MNRKNLQQIVNESKSKSEVCRKLGISVNGNGFKKVKTLFEEHTININILKTNLRDSKTKYPLIEKSCPVCGDIFKTRKGHIRETKTCSHSCSNTYFRSGEDNPNWKQDSYRSTCFLYHKKECIICGENKIVEVHHFDGNNKNNIPENLIPLCPTHHQYYHSKYRNIVNEKIIKFRNKFIKLDARADG